MTMGATRPRGSAMQIDRWENEGGTVGVSSREQAGIRHPLPLVGVGEF